MSQRSDRLALLSVDIVDMSDLMVQCIPVNINSGNCQYECKAASASKEGKYVRAIETKKWPWSLVICDDISESIMVVYLQNFENIFELSPVS